LVAFSYLLLAGTSVNDEGQVKRILFKTDFAQTLSNRCKKLLLRIYSQQGNFLNSI